MGKIYFFSEDAPKLEGRYEVYAFELKRETAENWYIEDVLSVKDTKTGKVIPWDEYEETVAFKEEK